MDRIETKTFEPPAIGPQSECLLRYQKSYVSMFNTHGH